MLTGGSRITYLHDPGHVSWVGPVLVIMLPRSCGEGGGERERERERTREQRERKRERARKRSGAEGEASYVPHGFVYKA